MTGRGRITEALAAVLSQREQHGLRRALNVGAGVDFSSNDYLGLSRHPAVVDAAQRALVEVGAGAPASRLLGGQRPIHAAAEARLARWVGAPRALLFTSGWHANLAVMTGLAGTNDIIFSDRLNHASLIDAMRLSRARVEVFDHRSAVALEVGLERARGARRRFIVTETVFSMDGDHAPLDAYLALAHRHDAYLLVDEAHALGVFGAGGAGLAATYAEESRLLARTMTGGKALGVAGGFVVGGHEVIDTVLNYGRSFIYTTAMPPPVAGALIAAIGLAEEGSRTAVLHARSAELRDRLGWSVSPSSGPILPIEIGEASRALRVAGQVREAGFDVRAVRPPTVPEGTSRLRIVCHADHSPEEIRGLADVLRAAGVGAPNPARPPAARNPARPPAVVVVGTDTGVGKTVVSALVVRSLLRQGRSCAYLKPVQTGSDSDTATVGRLSGLDARGPVVELAEPASVDQAARAEGVTVTVEEVVSGTLSALSAKPDAAWVLETAGGLLVPFNSDEDQADVLVRLGFPLLLVARAGLGTLNHTRLTLEAAHRRRLMVLALVLVGERHWANEDTLRQWHPDLPIFALPTLSDLSAERLDGWLARQDRALWEAAT